GAGSVLIAIACTGGRAVAQWPCSNPHWLPSDGIRGVNGPLSALVQWDADGSGPHTPVLVVGGYFQKAGGVVADKHAADDPSPGNWSSLGIGGGASVRALATLRSHELVAGGEFVTIGGIAANHLARWDGVSWLPLGGGVSGGARPVRALAVLPTGDLVAAG